MPAHPYPEGFRWVTTHHLRDTRTLWRLWEKRDGRSVKVGETCDELAMLRFRGVSEAKILQWQSTPSKREA